MGGRSKFSGFKTDPPKKTYPKHYTEKDIEFLKKQNEDIVREEDKKTPPPGGEFTIDRTGKNSTKNFLNQHFNKSKKK
jgi:hypothetical protein